MKEHIYYQKNNQQLGPFEESTFPWEEINLNTLIWYEGLINWVSLQEDEYLLSAYYKRFPPTPPLVPSPAVNTESTKPETHPQTEPQIEQVPEAPPKSAAEISTPTETQAKTEPQPLVNLSPPPQATTAPKRKPKGLSTLSKVAITAGIVVGAYALFSVVKWQYTKSMEDAKRNAQAEVERAKAERETAEALKREAERIRKEAEEKARRAEEKRRKRDDLLTNYVYYLPIEHTASIDRFLGGIKAPNIMITNNSSFKLDEVKVQVKYILRDNSIYKVEEATYFNVKPGETRLERVPDSNRGVELEYAVTYVRCDELEVEINK